MAVLHPGNMKQWQNLEIKTVQMEISCVTLNKLSVSGCHVIVLFLPLIWCISGLLEEQVFNSLDNRQTKALFK